MLRGVLVISFFVISSFSGVISQDKESIPDSIKSNFPVYDFIKSIPENRYITLLDSIKRGLSDDYFTLRMAYTKTQHWEPYNSEERTLEAKVRSLINAERFEDALALADSVFESFCINSYAFVLWLHLQ